MTFSKRRTVELSLAAVAFLLLFLPNRAFAYTQGALVTQGELVGAGSIWFETTIAVALVFVSAMAFSLQIARGYFIRVLNKFTLRLGADIWWLAYVLIRDGLIFMSFIMGLLVFFPGTFLDYPIAVPFMPVSVVLFGIALVTKLYFDADDNRNAFRAVTALVFGGTMLWVFGTIFVTETPIFMSSLPPGVSANSGMWYFMYSTFSSTSNLGLAMTTFQACFAVLGVIGVFGFVHPILHSRLPKLKRAVASETAATVTPVYPTATRSVDTPAAKGFGDGKANHGIPSDHLHYAGVEKERSADYIG
jgi:hypothetical protein